jgi:meso-butanediol dehydrogenase/(S,S)-butanediol dehydrogenase/diacetyl reductase
MKLAIVTGAARGIGLATSKILVDQGWRVAMVDRDHQELDAAAAQLANATPIICDVSQPDQVDAMVAEATAGGPLHALVNNAGVADFGPIEETTFARWRRARLTCRHPPAIRPR